jgi:uncharacterized membrane protein
MIQTECGDRTKLSQMNESDEPGLRASSEATSSEIKTSEVLAEVERRMEARRSASRTEGRVAILADRFVYWFSKRWLAVFNAFFLLYVGLPILAPVLMAVGAEWPATIIYTIYRPLCHQLPQRSFFLFGPQLTYRASELMERVGINIGLGPTTRAFVGTEAIGYKVALCQRDTAIYGAIFLFGLVYGLLRRRWKVPPLPLWAYIGFGIAPMLLDGGYQFLSYVIPLIWPGGPIVPREAAPAMRVITGVLFGLATAWLAYPIVNETMEEARKSLVRRFGWE